MIINRQENLRTEVSKGSKLALLASVLLLGCNGKSDEKIEMTFDDLGGGDEVIMVYPGVTDSSADRMYSGTYRDGDKVEAKCWTNGREVYSHPEFGEEERNSNIWIKFVGATGTEHFATIVYTTEDPEQVAAKISECKEGSN